MCTHFLFLVNYAKIAENESKDILQQNLHQTTEKNKEIIRNCMRIIKEKKILCERMSNGWK